MVQLLKNTNNGKESLNILNQNFKELEKLSKNTRGIKVATWVTAISTLIMAFVGVVAFLYNLFS